MGFRVIRAACLLMMILMPSAALAQSPPRPREARLYLGMWTTHLTARKPALDSNDLIAMTYGHFFAGTFRNSFDKRAYTAGLQWMPARVGSGSLRASFGFRLGAISGYDERFLAIAKDTPVMPIAQAFGLFEVKRVGVELSYTMVVASIGFACRF